MENTILDCEDCGAELIYSEGSYFCNNKVCGAKGIEVKVDNNKRS